MIKIGAQYYRPPFPEQRYWETDLAAMKDAGLNTLQMWVVWAWVEPSPGKFVFDDYDRIMDIAEDVGLSVILSAIAAVQPYWIHREVPGSEMVTSTGRIVVSSNRCETHYGLTPGGSISHPGVWSRMSRFLTAVVERYRTRSNLVGWDAWNELRWNVHANGLVDYSDAALAEFRSWLDNRYGGLDGLNRAWKRRYASWDDVRPGLAPDRTYTELMAFEHFISWRSDQHARKRYAVIKALDPRRPVTVHGAQPTILHGGDRFSGGITDEPATALHRGNDWFLADYTDGIGTSSFPLWGGIEMADEEFSARLDFMAAAAGEKRKWLSELQGGRSNVGFSVAQSVPAAIQQRWLWEGLSIGADAILFWCWRDEVFGHESTGFGLAGNDGLREERFAALRTTAGIVAANQALLEGYAPRRARTGVLFSPQAYYLYWAQDGNAIRPMDAIRGYSTALLRNQIPYTVVEECHLERLQELSVLFAPRAVVMEDDIANALMSFVERGGTLLVESETGAFGANGLYRYPEDRRLAALTGFHEIGRRILPAGNDPAAGAPCRVEINFNDCIFTPAATQWITPMIADGGKAAHKTEPAANGLIAVTRRGKGKIIAIGTYLGDAYYGALRAHPESAAQFEAFLTMIVADAGVIPPVSLISCFPETTGPVVIRAGDTADGGRLVFVFPPRGVKSVCLRFAANEKTAAVARDIISGADYPISPDSVIELHDGRWGFFALHVPPAR